MSFYFLFTELVEFALYIKNIILHNLKEVSTLALRNIKGIFLFCIIFA